MIICGIKLTHDGGAALIDNGRLVFSYEIEKLGNSSRFSEYNLDFHSLSRILAGYGYRVADIDRFVFDGWGEVTDFRPGKYKSDFDFVNGKFPVELAEYGYLMKGQEVLEGNRFSHGGHGLDYTSYPHISSHIIGAYCTSPFPERAEDSFVLVWDGAIAPQLFHFDYNTGKVRDIGALAPVIGHAYSLFANKFVPFDRYDSEDLSIAGKVMAYIALGKKREKMVDAFHDIYEAIEKQYEKTAITHESVYAFSCELITEFFDHVKSGGYKSEDAITGMHDFLQELLLGKLKHLVQGNTPETGNLCYAGGCALNIKWNSAIRETGLFKELWVPPFTNDSGSAVGAACCEMVKQTGVKHLAWDVYSGPPLNTGNRGFVSDWEGRPCSIKELADLLHRTAAPVVFLNGNAEMGPRALGNRSILAPAVEHSMKDLLNNIKCRESYRPVAPICLEQDAPGIFEPGTPDPFMLYDHKVKKDWLNKIPAIIHLDSTARLQTVNKDENPAIFELLTEYKKISGIPVLCNTSANYKGKGFFPDVASAAQWGGVDFIWNNQTIYKKR